jgi:DNA-binding transcriptional LysR family regulator
LYVDKKSTECFNIINMRNFLIPPEYGLIVKAFLRASTLRKAAVLLETDPASLVRKVQRISSEYGLLQKVGNRWVVTEAGQRVAQWTDESIARQADLLEVKPRVRISSFSWLAEEFLIPNFSLLNNLAEFKYKWSFKTIASELEKELINSETDFIITGHAPNDPIVAHKKLSSLNWVVIVPSAWKKKSPRKLKNSSSF